MQGIFKEISSPARVAALKIAVASLNEHGFDWKNHNIATTELGHAARTSRSLLRHGATREAIMTPLPRNFAASKATRSSSRKGAILMSTSIFDINGAKTVGFDPCRFALLFRRGARVQSSVQI
jgi:hypothetical protein